MSDNKKKPMVISSKNYWITKELVPYLEKIKGIKTTIYKQYLLINISNHQDEKLFCEILNLFNLTNLKGHPEIEGIIKTNFQHNFIFPPNLLIPEWNWIEFSKHVRQVFDYLDNQEILNNDYEKIIQIFLAGVSRSFRLIGNHIHPLRLFLESCTSYNVPFQKTKSFFNSWIRSPEGISWGIDNETHNLFIPSSSFIHLLRYSSEEENLIETFQKQIYYKFSNNHRFYLSEMPLLDIDYRQITVIQFIEKEDDLESVVNYWNVYASLVLRVLGYISTKLSMLKTTKDNEIKVLIAFFDKKLRTSFDKFVDSCINSTVIEVYRQYQKLMKNNIQFKRYFEFYGLYRGGIIERRYKKAEIEAKQNLGNRTFQKRAKRRKNTLITFMIEFFKIYDFIAIEGLDLTKKNVNPAGLLSKLLDQLH